MNSKGEVSNGILIGAIIFGALLVLLLVYASGGFGKIQNYFDNTPGFEDKNGEPMKIGIVRYDVQLDKVQSYDGERWTDMTKEVTFEGLKKSTNEKELNDVFESYYFSDSRVKGDVALINSKYKAVISGLAKGTSPQTDYSNIDTSSIIGGSQVIGGAGVELAHDAWAWLWKDSTYSDTVDYMRGEVILTIWNLDESGKISSVGGFIFVGTEGSKNTFKIEQTSEEARKYFGDTPEFSSADTSTITSKATNWRDSVFKEPSLTVQGVKFCLKKAGSSYLSEGRYIISDLNKVGENCNA